MPGPEHFGEQFGMSKREESQMAGKALADHLLDGMAQIEGYADWEHYATSKKNREDDIFREKYQTNNPLHGKSGMVKYNPEYDDLVYEIKHPSGWKGVAHGMGMDFHHPKHGAVDMISYTDYEKHGILSPATPDEWPDPSVLHADLDRFVNESGKDYDW